MKGRVAVARLEVLFPRLKEAAKRWPRRSEHRPRVTLASWEEDGCLI
jgi:hypothetical protein